MPGDDYIPAITISLSSEITHPTTGVLKYVGLTPKPFHICGLVSAEPDEPTLPRATIQVNTVDVQWVTSECNNLYFDFHMSVIIILNPGDEVRLSVDSGLKNSDLLVIAAYLSMYEIR